MVQAKMTPERYREINEAFQEAWRLPPEEREPLIARRCGNDPPLRAAVKELLADAEAASQSGFLRKLTLNVRRLVNTALGRHGAIRVAPTVGSGARLVSASSPTTSGEGPLPERGEVLEGRYEVRRIFGGESAHGGVPSGCGIVYVLFDHISGQEMAAKTLQDRWLQTPSAIERFFEEGMHWVSLGNHPNIIQAFGVVPLRNRHYIVMEYVPPDPQGRNCLNHYLVGSPLPFEQALRWAIHCCFALEHVRTRGIMCHRDIKPANIMVTPDQTARLTDWGISFYSARSVLVHKSQLTNGNSPELVALRKYHDNLKSRCGTVGYMAPEVLDGTGLAVNSDVFSLGVVLHQMATGSAVSPFARFGIRASDIEILEPVTHPFWTIIRRCLQRVPKQRYVDFAELRADLEALLWQLCAKRVPAPHDDESEDSRLCKEATTTFVVTGNRDNALQLLDRALELNPCNIGALKNRAALVNDPNESTRCYRRILEIDPSNGGANFEWANGLMKQGKFEASLPYYEAALRGKLKNDPECWLKKGVVLERLGRFEEAIVCYDHVLSLNEGHKNGQGWQGKATCLVELDKPGEALVSLENLLRLDEQSVPGWLNKGVVLDELGRLSEAAAAYQIFLSLKPSEKNYAPQIGLAKLRIAQERARVGYSLLDNGRFDDALREFDAVLKLAPTGPPAVLAHVGKAFYFGKFSRWEQLGQSCKDALAIDDRCGQAWTYLGEAYERLGQPEQARDAYHNALNGHTTTIRVDVQAVTRRLQALEARMS